MENQLQLTDSEIKHILNLRKEQEHEEYKYLHLMQNILDNGVEKSDRTGVGTKSIFGTQLKFNLSKSFPILTTKKVFWKGVVEELLWFIRGDTNSKHLEEKGVKIWAGNTSREFLDKRKLDYPEGFAGPVYGFQWRYWGASYNIRSLIDINDPLKIIYGVQPGRPWADQLADVVDKLKNNPNDRRILISAWNVSELNKVALPSCHILQQYYVENGKLHCHFYMRSTDSFLGLPFNLSSYALMTYLLAKITGLQLGTLTYSGGDTHLYLNHLDQAKEQISRTPYPFPQLNIKKDIKTIKDIEDLTLQDIELVNYQSHATIKAEMAI